MPILIWKWIVKKLKSLFIRDKAIHGEAIDDNLSFSIEKAHEYARTIRTSNDLKGNARLPDEEFYAYILRRKGEQLWIRWYLKGARKSHHSPI